jgi:hypothetical protein
LNKKNIPDIFGENPIAMKKRISMITLLGGLAILLAGAMILSSCEGPQGPPGLDGTDGVDGVDGVDANETCIVCHNAEVVVLAKQQQTLNSMHLTGGNYERNSADCAKCHTHQGFHEALETGAVAGSITDAAPINCRTCHMIHNNYDESDWMLVTESAVDLDFGGATIDLGGPANLCVNCHQFRAVNPMPVVGGGDVTITSSRWGPHHGPHANNLWGIGGYLIAGSKSYPEAGSTTHAEAGCTACHMAPVPYGGRMAGGHTFNMGYVYHEEEEQNIGACTGCHTTLEEFDFNGIQTEVEELLVELETIFIANGWYNPDTELWVASSSAPLVVTSDQAGAMLNYQIVKEDRSLGVHNPAYMIAILTNSLESIE